MPQESWPEYAWAWAEYGEPTVEGVLLGIEAAEAFDSVGGGSSEGGEDGLNAPFDDANMAELLVSCGASAERELQS